MVQKVCYVQRAFSAEFLYRVRVHMAKSKA
jgi:hypothetical protein